MCVSFRVVLEDEIVQGVFYSPGDPNKHCAWFKRTFTDLYAVSIRDPARQVFLDILWNSSELDSDALKSLNHLKETRMTAKYIGYVCVVIYNVLTCKDVYVIKIDQKIVGELMCYPDILVLIRGVPNLVTYS